MKDDLRYEMRKSAVVHMLCCFVNTFAVLIVKHMSNTSSHFEAAKHTKTSSRWRIDVLRRQTAVSPSRIVFSGFERVAKEKSLVQSVLCESV